MLFDENFAEEKYDLYEEFTENKKCSSSPPYKKISIFIIFI